ncbi:IS630 family transposase [Bacillus sp. JJ864]|uniref:IS630 family transposase n=1 Tax=Bacillus sp. JJ864 TaxID=3122975 RepID=UPI003000EBF4
MLNDTVLLYEDECHFREKQTPTSTWFLKGKQRKFSVYGNPFSVSLFGSVDAETGAFLCMEAEKCNAQTFQQFLTYVLDKNKEKHVIMIVDNAKYHHAKVLQDFLKQKGSRLTLLFLPPYSPNLNLVERVWKLLKETILANQSYKKRENLIEAIEKFLQNIVENPTKILTRIRKAWMLGF